jgi:hypothetical protein
MAIVVKWLTHLTVNQACVGSSPIGRPNLTKKADKVFFYFNTEMHEERLCYIELDEKNKTAPVSW